MNTTALIIMVSTMLLVASINAYFFVKVWRTPPRPEPDSFDENDDEPR
ncbi:MAG: hypothetical protein KIS94_15970 [Chitinophagales bacterium]|nr:hypothetical protein [Chitinophagales bacterium]